MLRNVSDELAQAVADGLGISLPQPMPRVGKPPRAEVTASPALSLTHRPGDGSIRGRKVAVLTAPGIDADSLTRALTALSKAGAVVRLLAARLGSIGDEGVEADATFETMPSVLFDAVVIPDGDGAADRLSAMGHVREFIQDQFRHGKPILMLGAGERVVADAGIPTDDGSDWALVRDVAAFMDAMSKHRNWDRTIDPPRV
jgi:catalase